MLIQSSLKIFCLLCSVLANDSVRKFKAYRYPPMEGLMPPIKPVPRVPSSVECAMMCTSDITCASFSHSPVNKMCMLSPEIIRQKDIDISNPIDHWYHFNVHEVLDETQIHLKQGYRWFHDMGGALRFHYYFPLNYNQSQDACQQEGAQLVTIDSQEKKSLILDALQEDEKEEKFGIFYTKPSNLTEVIEAPDNSTCSAILLEHVNTTIIPTLTCSERLPYLCEFFIAL